MKAAYIERHGTACPPAAIPRRPSQRCTRPLRAVIGFRDTARLEAADTVLVRGGSGNVGTAVTQIAAASGARVAAGGPEKAEWCRAAGAERVIHYRPMDETRSLRAVATEGVNLYWDAIRAFEVDRALEVLAIRGRIIVMTGLGQECELPAEEFSCATPRCSDSP